MANDINQPQPQGQPGQSDQGPGQTPRQTGTGFTNLQTLMGANTGNKLGQAVAGGIENTGQQASNALQQGQQDFNTQSQANAMGTQAQQQNVQDVLGGLGVGSNGQTTNPTSVTSPTSGDVSNFQNYMSGQYNGPTNIANISGIQNQASNAQQQGQQVGSAGGRQALLQQYAANPGSSYGSGAQNLDTALLGATGGNQLQQARSAVSGLTNKVNSAQSAAQQQGQQLTNQAQGFGQAVTGQVTGAANNAYGTAQQTAQTDNSTEAKNAGAEQAAVMAAQNGQLSAQDLQALGLNNGDRTYGVNVGQYMGYQAANGPATALNVMGQPQYQQYSGLNQLLGKTTGAQGNAYQAGQNTFDKTGLSSAISAAQAPLQQAQSALSAAQAARAQAGQAYLAMWQSGDSRADAIGKAMVAQADQQLAAAQQGYTNLNNQLSGSVTSTGGPVLTPQGPNGG